MAEPFRPWPLKEGARPIKLSDLMGAIEGLVGVDQLAQLLGQLEQSGDITEQQAQDFYNNLAPLVEMRSADLTYRFGLSQELSNYLKSFTSTNDLADKLNNITGLDDNAKADIFDVVTGNSRQAGLELRQAQSRLTSEQEKSTLASQKAQSQNLQGITPRLNQILNNQGLSAQDRGIISQTQRPDLDMPPEIRERYLAQQGQTGGAVGMSGQSFADYLDQWNQYGQNNLINQYNIGNQKNAGVMNALFGAPDVTGTSRELRISPQAPDINKILTDFGGGGYGEGTRLRSYIESQIPGVISDTAKERQAWWDRMNQRPGYGMAGSGSESSYWQDTINRNTELAGSLPSDTTLGETYWGEGGPAEVARKAAEGAQGELTGYQNREKALGHYGDEYSAHVVSEFENGRGTLEDPLKKALRSRNWLAGYYRLPGTGISSRLAPRVRYA